ncbi:hypothetical protein AVEN_180553-1 [Araneus ventricosus]|uniref:Reverse transcriptase domain-containing protein n=1 Tax=Araneus ventricosus TaxID=182803 RepID=A0A4Y2FJG8_ARAVE|nr:hypothetical protein AVEN_180553-1 [Araneus ventricosus]
MARSSAVNRLNGKEQSTMGSARHTITYPNWWTQNLELEKKRPRALRRRAQTDYLTERTNRFVIESKEKAIYKKKIKHARTSGWQNFYTLATNPYGKYYKAAFCKGALPSGNPGRSSIDRLPFTTCKEFLDKMFPQPEYSVNYSHQQQPNPDGSPFTKQEVSFVIKHLPADKAPGVDGIDNLVIKILHNKFPYLLTSFYNKCLHLGFFPDPLKLRNMVFFQKQGKDASPTISKLRPPLRTAIWIQRRTLNIKGSFDNLHHQAILQVLAASPCPANINKVFYNILQNRKASIQTPTGPVLRDLKKGYPQVSCSSPALWNLVANSALNIWPDNVHVQAFADDFAMVIHAPTKEKLKQVAQNAINAFDTWCKETHLEVAPEKTNYIILSKMVAPPKSHVERSHNQKVNSIKYLGIHIDEKLIGGGTLMLKRPKQSSSTRTSVRSREKLGISLKHRRILYKTVVERMLAHGLAAWCLNPSARMVRKLSSIERSFLLSLSGEYRTTPKAVPQAIFCLPPLHLQLQFEARHITLARLRKHLSLPAVNLQTDQI